MDSINVCEWTLDGALDDIKQIHNAMRDRQFAFILGSGASVSSGIPTGQHLAEKWLKDLYRRECLNGATFETWLTTCGIGGTALTLQSAAEYYPQIFERRFESDREAGYAELEVAMEGKSPSLGYSLLAEIIQHTRHKVVVTTNFDNLVADALAMHAHQSPLVVAHESLAGFVRPQMRRPLVAKIHRDLYLHPINDIAGVSTLEKGWTIALKKLFQYFTPIVVGYGGNDGSLMDMLLGLDEGDIAGRIIWCYREGSPPPPKAYQVLEKHRGVLVKIPGFDQFMLRLAANLVSDFDVAAIAERTADLGQQRADRYREQANQLQEISMNGTPAERKTGEVLTESARSTTSWWAWNLRAKNEANPLKRQAIYIEGIRHFPTSADLISSYAFFLELVLRDNDEAQIQYEKAIQLNPTDAEILGRYANFLEDRRADFDRAELLYKNAIALDPTDGSNLSNYADFLTNRRDDIKTAETYHRQAQALAPDNFWSVCRYAKFLANNKDQPNLAEPLFVKAIEMGPESAWVSVAYANFLAEHRHDYEAADAQFKKAIAIDPDNSWATRSYNDFLKDRLP